MTKLDNNVLKEVTGGITQSEFYAGDYLKQGCTCCGAQNSLSTEDGTDAATGQPYTIVRCSACGGQWKTLFTSVGVRI
ncbi:MAG: hypothetical protein IJS61_00550 [Firmicutes bacterium]|nr:hypothetical protein [Bacillota bacterium]